LLAPPSFVLLVSPKFVPWTVQTLPGVNCCEEREQLVIVGLVVVVPPLSPPPPYQDPSELPPPPQPGITSAIMNKMTKKVQFLINIYPPFFFSRDEGARELSPPCSRDI
jgi:hypothetical protein